MDYKKLHEETLVALQQRVAEGKITEKIAKSICHDFVKESEDDIMRKMAIKAVYAPEARSCIKSWGINPEDVIAWIEKQDPKKHEEELAKAYKCADEVQYRKGYEDAKREFEKQGKKIDAIENFDTEFEKKVSYLIASTINKEYEYNDGFVKWTANVLLNYAKQELEKQSEQKQWKPVEPVSVEDKLYLMQGKQKPTDEVEPKFKVGDWVVTSYGKVNQIIAVEEDADGFTLDDDTYFSGSWKNYYHLWSIQDAKAGDILTDEQNCICIFRGIMTNDEKETFVDAYCGIDIDNDFVINERGEIWTVPENLLPATKEQRDFLFQKMKEAGYEWNSERLELKKIEQKTAVIIPKFKVGDKIIRKELGGDFIHNPHIIIQVDMLDKKYRLKDGLVAHFSEEDDWELVEQNHADMSIKEKAHQIAWETSKHYDPLLSKESWCEMAALDMASWLKRQDNKPTDEEMKEILRTEYEKGRADAIAEMKNSAWSKEDERILEILINDTEKTLFAIKQEERPDIMSGLSEIYIERLRWLKSLKERVQPQSKPAWSEEDEKHYQGCLSLMKLSLDTKPYPYYDDYLWLKSLKPQPKVELTQLDENILKAAIAFIEQNNHFNCWGGVDKQTVLSALRSLRPQNTWKPTYEQMEALLYEVNAWDEGTANGDNLRSLYQDLKKLKEE